MAKKLNIDIVKDLFGSRGYELLTTKYINSKQKFEYMCTNGHRHSIRLDHFRNGVGCPYCSDKFKKSITYIKAFFEEEGYELISKIYVNAFDKLECICPNNHKFKTSWHNWSSAGHRCPICNGGVRKETSNVVDILASENYVLKSEYSNTSDPVKCICPNGHEYSVSIGNFVSKGSRCTVCSGAGSSNEETMLRVFIESLNIYPQYNDKELIKPYEVDIIISECKIAIEHCGLYWHSEGRGKDKDYHLRKLKLCEKKGYKLITIFEDELLFKKDIVFSRLRSIFNKINTVIYARNCTIKEISPRAARMFCEDNHLQGYGGGSFIKLGAFCGTVLVAVMTFSRPSISKGLVMQKDENIYELHRFCNLLDTNIVGIASKFIKYFVSNYKPKYLYSYADRRWSSGNLYEKIGFNLAGHTSPNYWYFKNKKRLHRFALRKTKNDPIGFTEWETRQHEGWDRIWDCGNLKYVMEVV